MGQVIIYLEKKTEMKMKKAAKSSGISVSKWVAEIIEEKTPEEWPQDIIGLAGSWREDFSEMEETRDGQGQDYPRENL